MASHPTQVFSNYNAPWTKFRDISNEKQSFLQCFEKHAADLDLQDTLTCLSIGAGCGESDAFLISQQMPRLLRYIAVEPDKGNVQELVPRILEAMPTGGNAEFYCASINDAIDNIQGPVDVVLLFEVMYYIADYSALFKRLKRLLTTGSKIIVSLVAGDIFMPVGIQHLKTWSDMADVQIIMRDLYPCPKFKEVTFNNQIDVSKVNVSSLKVIAASTNVDEHDVTAFKREVLINGFSVTNNRSSFFSHIYHDTYHGFSSRNSKKVSQSAPRMRNTDSFVSQTTKMSDHGDDEATSSDFPALVGQIISYAYTLR
ncbi:hypothetical protein CAPTEDRAFT_205382 [Capitella teleta]|uniref:Uncharacterized protein n=1 Tax=Capitella teleta TaxID=283909 RepID=R7TM34_CAPTE|nr:hypothetical protein CAPTEDRAFT_205382 [Capitella teleta]|eukprot:ELT94878.1 hypothetical protein CAPTEDRAFT_205382 [Capitella teleta]